MHAAEVALVLTLLALLLLPWLTLRDLLRQPPERWRQTGASRTVWAAVVVAVPVLGPALYLRRVRPRLRPATPG